MKNIIITGGSRGIGRAIALLFASKGYAVAISARNQTNLAILEKEINALNPNGNNIFQVCDMSKKTDVIAFANTILEKWKTVDILVNNAGTFEQCAFLAEEDSLLEKLIETNLYSAYTMSKIIAKNMVAAKKGAIYNICSVASLAAYPNGGAYSISKFAMLGFNKTLRQELKEHHIKVTALLPGATLTDSWAGVDLPADRFIQADDIAKIIFSLEQLSDSAVVEEILLRPLAGDI